MINPPIDMDALSKYPFYGARMAADKPGAHVYQSPCLMLLGPNALIMSAFFLPPADCNFAAYATNLLTRASLRRDCNHDVQINCSTGQNTDGQNLREPWLSRLNRSSTSGRISVALDRRHSVPLRHGL
jgi:hypothetical protein